VGDTDERRGKRPGGVTGKGFVRGRSGNPAGARRGPQIGSFLREAMAEEGADGKTVGRMLVDRLIAIALEGDRQAIKDIFDRVEGKVPDKVEINEFAALSDDDLLERARVLLGSPNRRQLALPDADA
jgi:hypothetical protein